MIGKIGSVSFLWVKVSRQKDKHIREILMNWSGSFVNHGISVFMDHTHTNFNIKTSLLATQMSWTLSMPISQMQENMLSCAEYSSSRIWPDNIFYTRQRGTLIHIINLYIGYNRYIFQSQSSRTMENCIAYIPDFAHKVWKCSVQIDGL